MFLSADTIRQKISEDSLIDPVNPKQLNNIEGSIFDLHVNEVWILSPDYTPIVGVEIRRSSKLEKVEHINIDKIKHHSWLNLTWDEIAKIKNPVWRLYPYNFYVLQSVETLNIPPDITSIIRAKRTYQVSGGILCTTAGAPGFNGKITCGLYVTHPKGMIIERGAGFVASHFAQFDTQNTDPYNSGFWCGDKATTDGVEPSSDALL